MALSSRADLPPWWLGALGALGVGASVAVPDLPLSARERLLVRAALIASSAAGAAMAIPEMPPPGQRRKARIPLSQQAGSLISFASSLAGSPLLGDRLIDQLAEALAGRGTRWPRARIAVFIASAALFGDFLQRFPSPPKPRTPPPRRQLVRPDSATIMRN